MRLFLATARAYIAYRYPFLHNNGYETAVGQFWYLETRYQDAGSHTYLSAVEVLTIIEI